MGLPNMLSTMASPITKDVLEHLAKLARIELRTHEEEKFLRDLQNILDHFAELNELDTSAVEPITGGTSLTNVFRDDEERRGTNLGAGKDQFPENQDGYLKVPPVFQ